MTRTTMLEVLRQDYIRTAWAKGLRERLVILRHVIKNALIPVVTLVGLQLPIIVGGAVIMEQMFAIVGLGRLMIDALFDRDYPLISGINLFFAAAVMIINLLVDVLYAYLDPRVHYQSAGADRRGHGHCVTRKTMTTAHEAGHGGLHFGPGSAPAKGQSFLRDLLRRLIRERPVGAVSGVIVLLLCLVAIFADLLAPFHYMDMTMIDRLKGPSSTYPLGTDHIGRGVLSRLLYGARVSLAVGFAATPECRGVAADRRGGGVRGRQARPGGAAPGGRLDVVPGPVAAADDHDHHRPGHPADHRHAGVGIGDGQLAGGACGGDRHQGQRLLRGGACHRQPGVADAAAPRVAEHHGADHHHLLDHDRLGDHRGGQLELSGVRATAGSTELGHDAEPGGAAVHGDGAAAGDVAGGGADAGGILPEHSRRRPARPAAARRRIAGRRVGARAAERAQKALQKIERLR